MEWGQPVVWNGDCRCPHPRLGKVVNRDKIRNEGMRKYFESARKDTANASKPAAESGNQPTEQVTWNTSLGPHTSLHYFCIQAGAS